MSAEDDVLFVCTECQSDQPEQYIERNAFAAAGKPVPCRYCGGVTVICDRKDRASVLREANRQRGL